jgi:hypothetical protein
MKTCESAWTLISITKGKKKKSLRRVKGHQGKGGTQSGPGRFLEERKQKEG